MSTAVDTGWEHGLSAEDRCDRCGAQGYVVTLHGQACLLWCLHHFNAHREILEPHIIIDERELIT